MQQAVTHNALWVLSTLTANGTEGPTSDTDTEPPSNVDAAWWRVYVPYKESSGVVTAVTAPPTLALGTFGNVMIILIMHRLSGSLLTVFFQVLAWSDLLVLTTGLLPTILTKMLGTLPIENLGTWPCRVFKVVIYSTGVVSPWMLVALTLQRAASVLWPHRVRAVWTQRKSRVAAAVLVSLSLLVHSHFVYGWGIDERKCEEYVMKCCPLAVSETYAWFHNTIWPWVDLVEFSFLPFTLLVISNSVLLWKLVASVRTAHRLPMQQSSQESRQKKVSSLTLTLLTVSASFFLLTTPVSVYFITQPLILPLLYKDPVLAGHFTIFFSASHAMWYANSAVNFYLYCLTGTKFRREFFLLGRQFLGLFCKSQKVKADEKFMPSSATVSSGAATTADTADSTEGRRSEMENDF